MSITLGAKQIKILKPYDQSSVLEIAKHQGIINLDMS